MLDGKLSSEDLENPIPQVNKHTPPNTTDNEFSNKHPLLSEDMIELSNNAVFYNPFEENWPLIFSMSPVVAVCKPRPIEQLSGVLL
ncbi:hypothetical protein TNCV_463341 [Trichonephila clavipes]|uniref:Uncharacterized protein n=1 Tax=Trichonephila inaurata madagascariensis TaxID=2747483 RepID=A0A8X6WV03_9ARAC|nr:hypothetical protein TNCV_463341 [Trichonephila clavipes]GFY41962.1 hypothetical protein TNIN_425561 [Trichonephila inaurata madagascariensis]